MNATLYKTDGTKEKIRLPKRKRLEFLQKLVEGLIEIVHIIKFESESPIGNDLIMNEEGLLIDLPANPFSLEIGRNSIWEGQIFRGNLILIDGILP